MPIEFNCPHCLKGYRVADSNVGKRVKCKVCGEPMTVPDLSGLSFADDTREVQRPKRRASSTKILPADRPARHLAARAGPGHRLHPGWPHADTQQLRLRVAEGQRLTVRFLQPALGALALVHQRPLAEAPGPGPGAHTLSADGAAPRCRRPPPPAPGRRIRPGRRPVPSHGAVRHQPHAGSPRRSSRPPSGSPRTNR